MKKRKAFKIILIIFALSLIIGYGLYFRPGSYAFAERYDLHMSEQTLINKIEKFKNENTMYKVSYLLALRDGWRDSSDLWYHVYFYLPDKYCVFKCWVSAKDEDYTTFAFVGILEVDRPMEWKLINKDFNKEENKKWIKLFEDNFYQKIIHRSELSN